jgi:hypothetical protein
MAANMILARRQLRIVRRFCTYDTKCHVNLFLNRKSCYYGDHINEDETGGDVARTGGIRNAYTILIRILSTFFYMEAKFGPSGKRIKND